MRIEANNTPFIWPFDISWNTYLSNIFFPSHSSDSTRYHFKNQSLTLKLFRWLGFTISFRNSFIKEHFCDLSLYPDLNFTNYFCIVLSLCSPPARFYYILIKCQKKITLLWNSILQHLFFVKICWQNHLKEPTVYCFYKRRSHDKQSSIWTLANMTWNKKMEHANKKNIQYRMRTWIQSFLYDPVIEYFVRRFSWCISVLISKGNSS